METENSQKNVSKWYFTYIFIKALLAIGIGLAFLLNPVGVISSLSYLLGVALVIFGLINIINGVKVKKDSPHWILLSEDGFIQVVVGLILVFWPKLAPSMIFVVLGIGIIFGGIIQLVIANKYSVEKFQRNFQGIIAIVLGSYIVMNPETGATIFSMVFGGLSVIYGIWMVILLLRFEK